MPCGMSSTRSNIFISRGSMPNPDSPTTPVPCRKQAHHHGLAVQHGDDRHADVHVGTLDANFYPAVLRHAFFGDVEVRENLDARDDCRLKPLDLRGH